MGYETIPSVKNYTPSGIVIQLVPHIPTIYDMSLVVGSIMVIYEGVTKPPFGQVENLPDGVVEGNLRFTTFTPRSLYYNYHF